MSQQNGTTSNTTSCTNANTFDESKLIGNAFNSIEEADQYFYQQTDLFGAPPVRLDPTASCTHALRLYYRDAHLLSFEGSISSIESIQKCILVEANEYIKSCCEDLGQSAAEVFAPKNSELFECNELLCSVMEWMDDYVEGAEDCKDDKEKEDYRKDLAVFIFSQIAINIQYCGLTNECIRLADLSTGTEEVNLLLVLDDAAMAPNINDPVFNVGKLYVKDLSVVVPSTPQIFLERETPKTIVQIGISYNVVSEGIFEVELLVAIRSELPDESTVYHAEVFQCGIFRILNVPEEELEPILLISCANILFPYAQEAVSDAVTRAGFQPVELSPVDFETMYHRRKQQASK